VTLLDSETPYAIKYEYQSEDQGKITLTYGIPENYHETSIFLLSQEEYPGCQNDNPDIYSVTPPYYFFRDTKKFASLPCSFAIKGKKTVKPHDGKGDEVTCDLFFARNGEIIGFHSEVCSDGSGFAEVVRGDLKDNNDKIPTISAEYGSSSQCSPINRVSSSDAKAIINNVLSFALTKRYANVTKKTIDKVEYDVYTDTDSSTSYVDKNDRVVRTESYDKTSGMDTITTYEYVFDDLSSNMFSIDKTKFSESCEDPKFYQAPDRRLCQYFVPPKFMCALSMDVETPVMTSKHYLTATPSGIYVLAIESSDGSIKKILRSDMLRFEYDILIPVVEGSNGKCNVSLNGYDLLLEASSYLVKVADEFEYVTQEQVKCGGKSCIKYCEDSAKTSCIDTLKSEPHYVVGYSYVDSSSKQPVSITFSTPKKLSDLSVFTLDKNKFSGCSSINSIAHSEPHDYCADPHSSDSSTPSSASSTRATFATVLAILAAVLISLF